MKREKTKPMNDVTIGQRILAAVLSHQLGISMDRALKLYARGREIHPSYEAVGEQLLKRAKLSDAGRGEMNPRESRA